MVCENCRCIFENTSVLKYNFYFLPKYDNIHLSLLYTLKKLRRNNNNNYYYYYYYYSLQKIGFSIYFKEINTFINQGCSELIKSDSQEKIYLIYVNGVLLNFLFIKENESRFTQKYFSFFGGMFLFTVIVIKLIKKQYWKKRFPQKYKAA